MEVDPAQTTSVSGQGADTVVPHPLEVKALASKLYEAARTAFSLVEQSRTAEYIWQSNELLSKAMRVLREAQIDGQADG